MKIKVIVGQPNSLNKDYENVARIDYTSKQKIPFLYLLTKDNKDPDISFIPPKKQLYTTTNGVQGLTSLYPDSGLILMNYNNGARISEDIANYRQYGIMTVPRDDYVNAVSIYKKEIWYEQDGYKTDSVGNFILENNKKVPNIITKEEKNYHLVTNQSDNGTIKDYNVANNRYYKYLYRFVYAGSGNNDLSLTEGLREIIIPVKVKWSGWSLTELHEQQDEKGKIYYTASLKDVWKFKNNIQPGEISQQLSKTQQETLARFPKFIHGPKNSNSGSVSCLLGRDVLPYDLRTVSYSYIKDKDKNWIWKSVIDGTVYNGGGYKEELWPNISYSEATSNKSVDMLDRWREFCYSGNLKLLKDNKGQKFIVQIHDVSNRIEETFNGRPVNISFGWTQVKDADDVVIIEEDN